MSNKDFTLRNACQQIQALLRAIPDLVYIKDSQRRNIMANKAYLELFGLKEKDIIGKKDEEILPADLATQCRASDEKVLKEGTIIRCEEYAVDVKGRERHFETIKAPIYDKKGKVIGIVGVSRDITESKLAYKRQREREELFRSVVESAYNGIAVIDENLKITYANSLLAQILGYPKEELLGKDFRTFLTRESKALFKDEMLKKYMSKNALWRKKPLTTIYELKAIRKDGEVIDIEVKAKVFADAYGKMRTVAQVMDVTEKKKLEAEKDLFEKRLSELNRYAQKLNMASSMEEICRLTLKAMKNTLGFEYASIFIAEERNLRMVAQLGYKKAMGLVLPLDGNRGVVTIAARKGQTIIVPDIRKEKAYVEAREGMLSELA
ncbi:PAS domain S-box protein, partial [Candidatus Bathyarchaeota archaeon]|nr:PAS domain S-box protein [Candidatus Bathyarchaeota archaeon]